MDIIGISYTAIRIYGRANARGKFPGFTPINSCHTEVTEVTACYQDNQYFDFQQLGTILIVAVVLGRTTVGRSDDASCFVLTIYNSWVARPYLLQKKITIIL